MTSIFCQKLEHQGIKMSLSLPLLKKELRETLELALPLVAALLAQIAMELVNSLMLGRLGADALAAGGLALALFFMSLIFCVGLFSAVGVLIARAHGALDHNEIQSILSQALYLAFFLTIPFVAILKIAPTLLLWIGEPAAVVIQSQQFLNALVWGILPLLFFFALREFVAAMSFTRIIMLLSLGITPLIAVCNFILMYGKWGFPKLGIAGIGYSTALMQWCLLAGILSYIYCNKQLYPYLFKGFQRFNGVKFLNVLQLGAPISITMGLEVGLFSITTILMGYFGSIALAAHQIALQCGSFAFMFPLGISQATAIRVGQNLGRKDPSAAKYAGFGGLLLGLSAASITAIIFISFPTFIIQLFIDTDVKDHLLLVTTAVSFLSILALFQLLDAVQVIMNGALRGFKDTFVPMWLGLLSYWISGLLSGYYLAFYLDLRGAGLWWGLGIGIGVSGILLFWRFYRRVQR